MGQEDFFGVDNDCFKELAAMLFGSCDVVEKEGRGWIFQCQYRFRSLYKTPDHAQIFSDLLFALCSYLKISPVLTNPLF